MSLFKSVNLRCPGCGKDNNVSVVGSVNADRRPDYRDAILDNAFQDATCEFCDTSFRTEPDFNYLEVGSDLWIAAMPARKMIDYLEEEDRALAVFNQSFGTGATPEAQSIGGDLKVRLTFGWPALREKLLARHHDLDDVALECMKTDLIRRLDSVPMAPGIELRLAEVTGDGKMRMIWVDALSEAAIEMLELDRALYDAIVSDAEGWAALRAELDNGPFVDMQKLYMGVGRSAA